MGLFSAFAFALAATNNQGIWNPSIPFGVMDGFVYFPCVNTHDHPFIHRFNVKHMRCMNCILLCRTPFEVAEVIIGFASVDVIDIRLGAFNRQKSFSNQSMSAAHNSLSIHAQIEPNIPLVIDTSVED